MGDGWMVGTGTFAGDSFGRRRISARIPVAILAGLLLVVPLAVPPPAGAAAPAAVPASSIDLVAMGRFPEKDQSNPAWGDFKIGPDTSEITISGCGCWLTVLAAHLDGLLGFPTGALPLYRHDLIKDYVQGPDGSPQAVFEPSLSFSPRYVDRYLTKGDPQVGRPGPGYTPTTNFRTCSTGTLPNALEQAAIPTLVEGRPVTGSGVTFRTAVGFPPHVQEAVRTRLLQRRASAVVLNMPGPEGNTFKHIMSVVGWDATTQQFLFSDPASPALGRGRTVDELDPGTGYDEFLDRVVDTRIFEPVDSPGNWFGIVDDPEPIEFLLIDPLGRRTGFRSDTSSFNEAPFDGYIRSDAVSDPSRQVPEDVDRKMVYQRDPVDGVYGLEILGTGDGSYAFSPWTSQGGKDEFGATISGSITLGQTVRYEVTLAGGKVTDVNPVDRFLPRAVLDGPSVSAVGAPIAMTGHRSSSVDATITSWTWDFGDGATATGRDVTHAFADAGTRTVTLTVADSRGETTTTARQVSAVAPPPAGRTTTMLTRSASVPGQDGGGVSRSTAVTPDGRFVAAGTEAGGMLGEEADQPGSADVYRFDAATGTALRVRPPGGTAGLGYDVVDISADGRYISFLTSAALDARDADTDLDLYVADLADPSNIRFELVGLDANGDPFTGALVARRQTRGGQMSADGRYVLVSWENSRQDVAGSFGVTETYLRDRQNATTTLVSATTIAPAEPNNDDVVPLALSGNGRFVVVGSRATNLPPGSGFARPPAVLFLDRQAASPAWEVVDRYDTADGSDPWAVPNSFNVYPGAVSDDGRFVLFGSNAQSFFPSGQRLAPDAVLPEAFVRDRQAQTTTHVGNGSRPVETDYRLMGTYSAAMTSDGSAVAFVSRRDDLVPDDTNATGTNFDGDAFLWDRGTGLVTRESLTADGSQADRGARLDFDPGIAVADDTSVLFLSGSTNLTAETVTRVPNLFRRGPAAVGGSNGRPVAELGGPYVGFAAADGQPAAIALNPSRSVDPEGVALSATVDPGDGSPPSGPAPAADAVIHAYDRPGSYSASATVRDGSTTSAPATARVDVLAPPGRDSLTFENTCAAPGASVRVGGIAASANATLLAEGWDLSRGPVPLADVTITGPWLPAPVQATSGLPGLGFEAEVTLPDADGVFEAQLEGTDATARIVVPCPPAPQVPVALAGGPYSTVAGEPLTLDGSGSTDPLNEPLEYAWTITGFAVTTAAGQAPGITFALPGTYLATLVVKAGERTSSRAAWISAARAVITVAPRAVVPPPTPPTGPATPPVTPPVVTDPPAGPPSVSPPGSSAAVSGKVYFRYKKANLTQGQKRAVRRLLAQVPTTASISSVASVGVVRAKGGKPSDLRLALARAAAVRDYLRARGVTATIEVSNAARTRATSAKARRVNVTIVYTRPPGAS